MQQDNLQRKGLNGRRAVLIPKQFKPRFWEDSDRRCAVVKTIKRRYELLKQDTGADSLQKDLMCQRAAFISVVLETQEVNAAEGQDVDLGSYIQASNGLIGLLKALGLNRHQKPVGDLKSYLEEKQK